MNEPKAPHPKPNNAPREYVVILTAFIVLLVLLIVLGMKDHALKTKLADTNKQLTQAKSDDAQNKTALDKAQAASNDLQAQLDTAKRQQADLQAQLDQAKQTAAQVQPQLDKAKAESDQLQAQLEKAKSESIALQAQVTQSSSGSSQLLQELDQEKIRTLDLQSRLQKAEADIAQLQPMLLKARHLPVNTSVESVHRGKSSTLHIHNLYLQPMTAEIAITHSGTRRVQRQVLGSGATLNIEQLSSGDTVVISSDGYDPVNVTVP